MRRPKLSPGFGISTKLLLAIGGAFAVAIIIAASGWYGFENIASSQRTVISNAIPSMRKAQQLAEVNASIVASSGRLARSTSDGERATVNSFLNNESQKLQALVETFQPNDFNRDDTDALSRGVGAIRANLLEQNELVKRRIELNDRASALSGELIEAADNLTELSESLVANAASGATATSTGLYDLIASEGSPETAFTALDRLVEVDLDGMERMFEFRIRSARVASFIAQLNREVRPEQIQQLAVSLVGNLEILNRRLADINDPGRKAQAAALLESVTEATRWNNPDSVFSLRLAALETARDIGTLVESNAALAERLTSVVSRFVSMSSRAIDESTASAQYSLRTNRLSFLSIAGITAFAAIGIFWLFLRRQVVQRLQALETSTRAIAQGNLSTPVAVRGADELTNMAQALEVFRDDAIEKRKLEQELKTHQQELEALVRKRTGQLEDANRKLEKTVRQHAAARERAEQANKAKTTFLATMSHELRTPVSGMLGVTRLLEDDNDTDNQKDYLHALRTTGNSLLNIVNDVLDLSKLESGDIRLDHRPFNLETMTLDLIALMRSPASAKDLDLAYSIDPDIKLNVVGDEDRLRQVLTNLLNNAIKFTHKGSVELSLEDTDSPGDSDQHVRFTVSDTGIGVPEDLQQQVFEPFTQVESSMSRRRGGSGLGLAICRRLVDAMGGKISLSSTPAQGTRLVVDIPFEIADHAVVDLAPSTTSAIEHDSLRVLVVEDDPVNRMVARRYLESFGHAVTEVETGREAIHTLETENSLPDIVLMDIGLPDMDGVQTTRMIREHPRAELAKLPVVAMSAHVFREEINEYLRAGMSAYLGKPFEPKQLAETLTYAIKNQPVRIFVSDDRAGSPILFDDFLRQDLEQLGPDATREIIELFIDSSQICLEDFATAAEAGDYATAREALHRLKSSSGSIGLEALRAESERLEKLCLDNALPSGAASLLVDLVEQSKQALLAHWSSVDVSERPRLAGA